MAASCLLAEKLLGNIPTVLMQSKEFFSVTLGSLLFGKYKHSTVLIVCISLFALPLENICYVKRTQGKVLCKLNLPLSWKTSIDSSALKSLPAWLLFAWRTKGHLCVPLVSNLPLLFPPFPLLGAAGLICSWSELHLAWYSSRCPNKSLACIGWVQSCFYHLWTQVLCPDHRVPHTIN